MEEKTYKISPCGEFNMQSFPLIEGNTYEYTEAEFKEVVKSLNNKTKHWVYENYVTDEFEHTYGTGKATLKDYTAPAKTEAELKEEYNSLVEKYIREKYSVNDELKIHREHQAGIDSTEFDELNAYILECKAKAHQEVYGN